MRISALIFLSLFFLSYHTSIFARVTPNDIYEQNRQEFEAELAKISDKNLQDKIKRSDDLLYEVNQAVCQRFDSDLSKLSLILEEIKKRKGVTETTVAFGMGNSPLDTAAYWLNYAAEAVAYQKIADYTPDIASSNIKNSIFSKRSKLKSDLTVLAGKISKAKGEIKDAFEYVR